MLHDLLVFIGRFQPFHKGHLAVIREGLNEGSQLLVLVGSADRPRNIRDPFTAEERAEVILACLTPEERARVSVMPVRDAIYNEPIWIRNVQQAVFRCLDDRVRPMTDRPDPRIALVGHGRNHSEFFLRKFPTWGAVNVGQLVDLSGTDLRSLYLDLPFEEGQLPAEIGARFHEYLPQPALDFLKTFAGTAEYRNLKAEQAFINLYRSQFAGLRYPPTFNTADAIVIQSGHVLLVKRGARPGLGQLALPGGFVNQDETSLDACIRELREETRLKVPEPVLRGSLTDKDSFDDPFRSTRGRTFTTVFRFDLRADTELPRARGGDDAREAFWQPLASVRPDQMFEDHYYILQKMVGL